MPAVTGGIVLVTMPWDTLTTPSIRIGILKAVLDRENIPCQPMHLHLLAMRHFGDAFARRGETFTAADYQHIANSGRDGLGEWVFAISPFRIPPPIEADPFITLLGRTRSEAFIDVLARLRDSVPAFLEAATQEVLALKPRVIGFSTTFSQTIPSIILAKLVKAVDPSIRIVFGGANCEGSMGPALLRLFPEIDVVVRGEGERVFPPVARGLLTGTAFEGAPGICVRRKGDDDAIAVTPADPHSLIPMDDVPVPDYGDYFERLEQSELRESILGRVTLPFESSRGCWWGAKHHCTFCGLNGQTMTFRHKSPRRVEQELLSLAERYRILNFEAVDNIVPMTYFRDLFPRLQALGFDFRLFYETKANLTRDQLLLLRDVGVRSIQPGIESLSTPILQLMDKGVTALQNIRLLKWCTECEIYPDWNIIYGIPGEPLEDYARMPRIVDSLTHLAPPSGLVRLQLDRFSPYFNRPADYGIELTGPNPLYSLLFPGDSDCIMDLAYTFTFRYLDGRDPPSYAEPLRIAIDGWRKNAGRGSLTHERGPGFLRIVDRRVNRPNVAVVLGELEATIYLSCENGAKPEAIAQRLSAEGQDVGVAEVARYLDEMVERRFCYAENGRYLSLSTSSEGARRRTASTLSVDRMPVSETADDQLIQLRAPASHSRSS
jgi:ribosomal peptide maturation radical SAM protein 1